MKTKRPYRSRVSERMHAESVLRSAHDAIADAVDEWAKPDSPEAFCFAMKGLMVQRDRIAAMLGISRHNDLAQTRRAGD